MDKDFTIEELEQMLAKKRSQEAKKKKLAEEAKAKKLAAEKESRIKEIEDKQMELNKLYKNFIKDYGYLHIENKYDDYPFRVYRKILF